MTIRRKSLLRLSTALPLLAFALAGKQMLHVDVENLAMKSRGTSVEAVAERAADEFETTPRIFLLATAIAPQHLAPVDSRALAAWTESLRQTPAAASLQVMPSPPTQACLAITPQVDAEGRYANACDEIIALAREQRPAGFRLAISGVPVVEIAIARELASERATVLPWIVGGLACVLLLIYRHISLVLAGLFSPLIGTLLLEGIQGWSGLRIDPVSALLGPTILTVGVASSVHLLERTRQLLRQGLPIEPATRRAARALRTPMALTVLTTAAGFLGLTLSPIPAVVRFGWLACLGILLVISATLFYLPPLLCALPVGRRYMEGKDEPAPHTPLARTSAIWASALCITLFGAGAIEMQQMRVDSDPLQVLPFEHPVRVDSRAFAEHLGGSETFALLLPQKGPTGLSPLLGLTARIQALDGIVGPVEAPRTSASGAVLLRFLLTPGETSARSQLFEQVELIAEQAGWPEAAATGLTVRMTRDSQALIAAQRGGVLITSLALLVVMAIGFRSIWLGFLGLLPNILPLVILQGSLAWLDRPLTVASSMIGVVMLGLVVDDTIHLLHAFREASGSAAQRTAEAMRRVRRPIVITTAVLCVGFAATGLGSLEATREFGMLAVGTLILALLADLIVLPLLLAGVRHTSTLHFQEQAC